MNHEQDISTIRQYLNGELDEAAVQAFQQRMDEEDAFGELVASETLRHHERLKLKQRLENIQSEIGHEPPEKKGFWTFGRIAAALLILVGLSVWIWMLWPSPPLHYAAAYETYFVPHRATSITRGESEDQWEYAMKDYRQGNYALALKNLTGVSEPVFLRQFYSGICYLALDEPLYDKAILNLEQVLETDNDYHQLAHWYLALAHLGKGDVETAKSKLKVIAQSEGVFKQQEAQALLDQL